MILYKDIVELAKLIRKKCKSISDMMESEVSSLENLRKSDLYFSDNIEYLTEIKQITSKELQASRAELNYNEAIQKTRALSAEKLLENYSEAKNIIEDINRYISALKIDIPESQKLLDSCNKMVEIIERNPNFSKWLKKCRKYILNYPQPARPLSEMHEILLYHHNEINDVINKGSGLIHSKGSAFSSASLYNIYQQTIAERNGYIFTLKDTINFLNNTMDSLQFLRKSVNNEVCKRLTMYQDKFNQTENEIREFPYKSKERLMNAVKKYFNEVASKVDTEELRSEIYFLNSTFIDWHSKNIKSSANERYKIFSHIGDLNCLSSRLTYIDEFKKRLIEHYPYLIKQNEAGVYYKFPEIININSSSFNYVIDASKVTEMDDKKILNSLVQNFVASTIANFPAGKTRFLFCDPENTGVFSVFRDIGKINDNIDISTYCDYTGSQKDIEQKLDSICLEITDIINHVLIGTDTTLYDHNKNNEFNNRPYKFIMIMDFPRQMNVHSLESLRNIIKNGPRCGIFTVLVSINQTNLLNDAEKDVVNELIKSPAFFYNNKCFKDIYGNRIIIPSEEINTKEFMEYTELYNDSAKSSSVIKIDIDSIKGRKILNGEYNIPVGKSTGGKTETIGFYDQCQHFLLSGATG
ncbi:MAG: hypothetical protein K2J39_06335, partial [Ruminococcus sp.]|nr:hypothetical protein [Ruminococcus sp.]